MILASCSKDNELQKSIYVRDSKNPELPAYSEWGYNTFGAYYDRQPFVSNDYEVPAKLIVADGSTSFFLTGQIGPYYNYSDANMTVTFILRNFAPNLYNQLILLNDSVIDLKNPLIEVKINIENTESEVKILNGKLEFKHARNLIVDTKPVGVILSGYFEFQAVVDTKPVTMSDGRFDVGVLRDNFYVMDEVD